MYILCRGGSPTLPNRWIKEAAKRRFSGRLETVPYRQGSTNNKESSDGMNDEWRDLFPKRKRNRLQHYDYSSCNYYFLTLCTKEHKCIFGEPGKLGVIGTVVQEHIQRLPSYYRGITVEKYVVMPNHVHMIVQHEGKGDPDISQIVASFKTGVTKQIRSICPGMEVWQRSFHDHIIRDQKGYEKIWLYIDSNPQNWSKDCFFPKIE